MSLKAQNTSSLPKQAASLELLPPEILLLILTTGTFIDDDNSSRPSNLYNTVASVYDKSPISLPHLKPVQLTATVHLPHDKTDQS